jgi:hypothetical protein
MKSLSRMPSSAMRAPATASEVPYMGDESTTFPFNRRTTSRNWARAAASAPTSKVCQVPTPIAGNASPVEGIFFAITRCG